MYKIDKINRCKNKYGYSIEDAIRIVESDDIMLSLDELRAKYDDDKIGTEYPEWISPITHYEIVCEIVGAMYKRFKYTWSTYEDILHTVYLQSLIKLHRNNSIVEFRITILNICKNLIRDYYICDKYVSDEYIDTVLDSTGYITIDSDSNPVEESNSELIKAILSIHNETIRNLLILCGYFIADISELKCEVDKIYSRENKTVQKRLLVLLDRHKRLEQNITKTKKITFKSICVTLRINESEVSKLLAKYKKEAGDLYEWGLCRLR